MFIHFLRAFTLHTNLKSKNKKINSHRYLGFIPFRVQGTAGVWCERGEPVYVTYVGVGAKI